MRTQRRVMVECRQSGFTMRMRWQTSARQVGSSSFSMLAQLPSTLAGTEPSCLASLPATRVARVGLLDKGSQNDTAAFREHCPHPQGDGCWLDDMQRNGNLLCRTQPAFRQGTFHG